MLNKLHHFIVISLVVVSMGADTRFHSSPLSMADTPKTREIMATLERAYELLDTPADVLDVDELDEVFIDHPDYLNQISVEEQAQLKSQISEFMKGKSAASVGYLTSMKSKRIFQKQGIEQLRVAQEKAKAEHRVLTQAELDELTKQNHGLQPSLPDPSAQNYKRTLQYFSIEINGDKARATYDEGVTGRTALLVRMDGRWYVAGIF